MKAAQQPDGTQSLTISEKLAITIETTEFIHRRGLKIAYAKGYKYELLNDPDAMEFNDESIEMTFKENTRHDSPDYVYVTLHMHELEMNDEDFEAHLLKIKANYEKELIEKEQRKEADQRKEMLRQYNALKDKLGI